MNFLTINSPPPEEKELPELLSSVERNCMDYQWTAAQWRDFLDTHRDNCKIFIPNGAQGPEGILLFHLNPWSKQAHLLKIGLSVHLRGSGAATTLLNVGREWLNEQDYEEIFLEVSASNKRAIAFYEKNGFSELCVKKQFYSDGADGLAMLLSL